MRSTYSSVFSSSVSSSGASATRASLSRSASGTRAETAVSFIGGRARGSTEDQRDRRRLVVLDESLIHGGRRHHQPLDDIRYALAQGVGVGDLELEQLPGREAYGEQPVVAAER